MEREERETCKYKKCERNHKGTGNNIETENVESEMEVGRDNDEKVGMVETETCSVLRG